MDDWRPLIGGGAYHLVPADAPGTQCNAEAFPAPAATSLTEDAAKAAGHKLCARCLTIKGLGYIK